MVLWCCTRGLHDTPGARGPVAAGRRSRRAARSGGGGRARRRRAAPAYAQRVDNGVDYESVP